MVELLPGVLQVLDPQAPKTETKANSDVNRIWCQRLLKLQEV